MSMDTIRMLSIDDRSITTELDRAGYRKMGVAIRSAATFTEAQAVLASNTIDVIVINLDSPKLNAVSVCQVLKADENTKKIPIVATSVLERPSRLKDIMKAGCELFMEQPMPRQFFIEKIRTLLDQKTRTSKRVTHAGRVSFKLDGKDHLCEIGDLSHSGILLMTTFVLQPGTKIELSFEIPGYKKPIEVIGEAVRQIASKQGAKENLNGIGVRFIEFVGDSQKRLEKYVAKTESDDPKLAYYL